MVIVGRSGMILPNYAVETIRLLGGGVAGGVVGLPRSRLAILPGTTHVTLVDRTEWLLPMIAAFLDMPAEAAPRRN